MTALSQYVRHLSTSLCLAVVTVGVAGADMVAAKAAAATSPYFGRWTVADKDAPFSARGREYKMFDIAPCGKDFCGVSVAPNGKCGPTLFRFLSKNRNADELKGHGKWGTARKNVMIFPWREDDKAPPMLQLYLGEGYDFGERSSNMPKFDAGYRKLGAARCTAR